MSDFTNTPTIGNSVTTNGITYNWNGTKWITVTGAIVSAVAQSDNGTIDLSKSNFHKILINSDNLTVPVDFSNITNGSSKWTLEITLNVPAGVSDSILITWVNNVIWEDATAPVILANQNLIIEFYSPNSGTTIYGIVRINKDNT
jgi:hypothetical protein|tara:strand:+ start:2156 stop:2590 length:435 start_codon:yes stop_codon:yes gene_type:complete